MEKQSVKERVLETAERLFYEQGYLATGINQIIKEAKTAKASFYHHFPSKEDLCVTYLKHRAEIAHERQKSYITQGNSPSERVANLFGNIEYNAKKNNFRGCPFLNIAAEITDRDSPMWEVITGHKSRLKGLIKDALGDKDNKDMLTEQIYLIYEGTNIAVKNFANLEPIENAKNLVKNILEG